MSTANSFNLDLVRERERLVRTIAARAAGNGDELHPVERLPASLQEQTPPEALLRSPQHEPHSARRKAEFQLLRVEDEMIRLVGFRTNIPRARKLARIGRIHRLYERRREIALSLALERAPLTLSP